MEFAQVVHNSDRYRELVALRRRVLRTPLGLDFAQAQLENERTDVHIAAYLRGKLVGCVVLTAVEGSAVKLRQMTVDPDHQGRGIGKQIVAFAERLSWETGYRQVVLHARESAAGFYESVGYVAQGEVFTEATIPHRRMIKHLTAQS